MEKGKSYLNHFFLISCLFMYESILEMKEKKFMQKKKKNTHMLNNAYINGMVEFQNIVILTLR